MFQDFGAYDEVEPVPVSGPMLRHIVSKADTAVDFSATQVENSTGRLHHDARVFEHSGQARVRFGMHVSSVPFPIEL
ncbi:hypothetical protein [Streptomyces kronopolitis]